MLVLFFRLVLYPEKQNQTGGGTGKTYIHAEYYVQRSISYHHDTTTLCDPRIIARLEFGQRPSDSAKVTATVGFVRR